MPESGDGLLWDRLRSGEKSALKLIYEQQFDYLFNYGRRIFQNTELVEDCIHDLFVEIWQRHDSLGATDSIRKYLAASLRRKVISILKKEQKIQSSDSMEQMPFELELSIEDCIMNAELSQEQSQKLKMAFAKLTDKQKEILYLRFYQGLEYEQISDILDVKYQSLRNAVSRAIKNLRGDFILVIIAFSQSVLLTSDTY